MERGTILIVFVWLAVIGGCSDDIPPRAPNFVVEAFITADEMVNNVKIKELLPLIA